MNTAEPFRERTGRLVAPGDRRIKFREGVRLVVHSPDGRVLLFRDTDPGLVGSGWWVTPGGGIDPGESELQAAVRELAEETGWSAQEADFAGPVLSHIAVHGYSDQVLVQRESFFALATPAFEVNTDGFTELEQRTLSESAWCTRAELAGREVWPTELADVLAGLVQGTVPALDQLGVVEESTVPLTFVERRLVDDQLATGFPAGTIIEPDDARDRP